MNAWRRRLLTVVLGSIVVNAVLGIYALLAPDFGELQKKVLGTSACVTGCGVLVFACLPALEQRRMRMLPIVGMAAGVVGFALAVVAIWSGADSQRLGKALGSFIAVGALCALPSVLSLARLEPRFRVAIPTAAVLSVLLAALAVGGIWSEPSGSAYARLVGVVAVLLAAVTISIPILHRASRAALEPPGAPGEARFCPSCGTRLVEPGVCRACGARFRVEYEPGGVGDGAPGA